MNRNYDFPSWRPSLPFSQWDGITIRNNRVERINLSNRGVHTVPESFGNLDALTTLYIRFTDSLTSLPESFGNLVNLELLDLRQNDIDSLPESIGNLTKLETLSLASNSLTDLPESFKNLTSLT
ncbi:MAG: hypothetical protein GY777_17835 [Candidatus Brocadiaceae bacterium]|nr:hypothetical protein [Candidatus Brocadiaceae bacterium]